MARKKKLSLVKKGKTPAKQSAQTLIQTRSRSLVIGAAVVVGGLALLAFALSRSNTAFQPLPPVAPSIIPLTVTAPTAPKANPTKTEATPTQKQQQTQKPTVTPSVAQKAPVKKLPNTSKGIMYTMQDGDSIARVGNTLCGDTRAYLYIAEDNNLYEPYVLQPGDTILVQCR